jgi:hypothetical protein
MSTTCGARHLSIILRKDGSPFASSETPIVFADQAALDRFIEERGESLQLSGHRTWHLVSDADKMSQDEQEAELRGLRVTRETKRQLAFLAE